MRRLAHSFTLLLQVSPSLASLIWVKAKHRRSNDVVASGRIWNGLLHTYAICLSASQLLLEAT